MKTEKTILIVYRSGEKWYTRPKGVPADVSLKDSKVTGPYPTKVAAERKFKTDKQNFTHFTGPRGRVFKL